MRVRCGVIVLIGVGAPACNFASLGQGIAPSDDGTTGSTGDTDTPHDTDHDPSDAMSDAGPGSGPGSDPVADDSTGASGAHVVFVQGSPIALGEIVLADGAPIELELRNDGDAPASSFSAGDPVPPLRWAGDAFPGTGGTCEGELLPSATCSVVLAPARGALGPVTQTLVIDYDDTGIAEQATTELALVAHGTTENLLVNGSGEDGPLGEPPRGWMLNGGGWHTSTGDYAYDPPVCATLVDGAQAIHTGMTGPDPVGLLQDVMIGDWADLLASDGLGVSFAGWACSHPLDTDAYQFVLRFFDAESNLLDESNSGWQQHDSTFTSWSLERPLPPGTHRIRIALRCDKQNDYGMICSVWFDALDLRFVYPSPV